MVQSMAKAQAVPPAQGCPQASETVVATGPDLSLEERQQRFKAAMSLYPSGVTIVTTADSDGVRCGFTATSFCSVSMSPPLVLFCLAKSAQCHPAFLAAKSWVVHVISPEQTELALRFATRDIDKFNGCEVRTSADGHPVLDGSCAVLECTARAYYDGGDHTIVVGEVADAQVFGEHPAVYFRRGLRPLTIP